jgi:hypothetical protein
MINPFIIYLYISKQISSHFNWFSYCYLTKIQLDHVIFDRFLQFTIFPPSAGVLAGFDKLVQLYTGIKVDISGGI